MTAPRESPKIDFMLSEGGSSGVVLGNRYEVVGELGRGAMGIVYKAIDTVSNRAVAIKILPQQLASSQDFVSRFRREAAALALLEHENIVGFHGFESHPEGYLLVMEYVDGDSLAGVLEKRGTISPKEAASIAADVALALSTGHSYRIVHRDIKPDNILIDRVSGKVKVSDFGIAAVPTSRLTDSGMTIGTLRYISPEQIEGAAVTASADLYSLGIVLYEMVAGRPPFLAEVPANLFQEHLEQEPPPLRKTAPQSIPRELDQIVRCALQKQPRHRFSSAEEMADRLLVFCGRRVRQRSVGRRIAMILLACTIAGGATFGAIKLLEQFGNRQEPIVEEMPIEEPETHQQAVQTPASLFARLESEAASARWRSALATADSLKEQHPQWEGIGRVHQLSGFSYQALGEYQLAIVEYGIVRDRYPESEAFPAALLGLAQSYEAIGREELACASYEFLVENRPESTQADAAREWIAERSAEQTEIEPQEDVEGGEAQAGGEEELPIGESEQDQEPVDEKPSLASAREEFEGGNFGSASTMLQTFLGSNPPAGEAAEATYLLGRCYQRQSQHRRAISEFERVRNAYSSWSRVPEALYQIAESYDALGESDSADRIRKQLIERYPTSESASKASARRSAAAEALLQTARAAKGRREFEAALRKLDTYLEYDISSKERAQAQFLRGECLAEKGDCASAIRAFADVERSDPQGELVPKALLETARCHERLGDGEGKTVLESIIRRYAGTGEARTAKEMLGPDPGERLETARKARERGDHQAAIAALQELIDSDPTSEYAQQAFASLLESYWEQKNYKMTVETGTEVLRRYPGTTWTEHANARMSQISYNFNKLDDTIRYGLEVLKKPSSEWAPQVRFAVADAYYRQDRHSEAIPHFEAYVQAHSPDQAEEALYKLGWCYNETGDYDKGIGAFQQVVDRFATGRHAPDAMRGIADCYGDRYERDKKRSDLDKARDTLRELIRRYPGTPAARIAEEALKGN